MKEPVEMNKTKLRKEVHEEREQRKQSINWGLRQNNPVRRFLNWLERITLMLETPINKWVRASEFNPLYHTGTITTFLLLIILATGVYLTLFYQFGFEVSYNAVEQLEANLIGRIIRALHRYASGAAIITTLLHGWRTFFQDRFRGPRWLAWVSGVLMAALVWAVGVSGYWLIWDERARVINQTLINILGDTPLGVAFLTRFLVTETASTGWIFIVIVIVIHLGLSAVIGLLYWYHIKRLNRPKHLPPRYWMWVTIGLLFIASVLVPVGMLPRIDAAQMPGTVTVDAFYLFYLPAALNWSPWVVWGGALALLALLSAIPWLLVRKPLAPVVVDAARCTGCTLCEVDCPYKAIIMTPLPEGERHKYLAVVDPEMCVACGICIGSCPPLALTLGEQHADVPHPPELLWQETIIRASQKGAQPVKVVFTCERHAYQGAKPFLSSSGQNENLAASETRIEIVPLTCVGMAHPNLVAEALDAGAAEVQFVGCPPEDCTNREGNQWVQERLERERKPMLKRKLIDAPITTSWVPPNEFARAVKTPARRSKATTYGYWLSKANWRGFLPALVLLGVVLSVQVWLSDVPYQPYPADQAMLEITMKHQSGMPIAGLPDAGSPLSEFDFSGPTRLVLEVDGPVLLDESYPARGKGAAQGSLVFEQVVLSAGTHHLQLMMFDQAGQEQPYILFDDTIELREGQTLALDFVDVRLRADPEEGKSLYYETSLGTNASCRVCHSLRPDVVLVGPSFAGVAERAATRVPGMSAEEYLRQSIIDPNAYVVEGFPKGQMSPNLEQLLTKEQIEDLIAFLLTQ